LPDFGAIGRSAGTFGLAVPEPVVAPVAAPLDEDFGTAVTEPALEAPPVAPCEADSPPAGLDEFAGELLLCAETTTVDANSAAATIADIPSLDCISVLPGFPE
jgi:hypothetical protein